MTRPTFSSSISLGNVLTIMALIVAGVAAFVTVQGQVESNAESISKLLQESTATEARVRALELDAARNSERLTSIHTLLSRIDARLERIERQTP